MLGTHTHRDVKVGGNAEDLITDLAIKGSFVEQNLVVHKSDFTQMSGRNFRACRRASLDPGFSSGVS